ncbi:hypothetical protein TKK_0011668 [Trichogramma kaykai]
MSDYEYLITLNDNSEQVHVKNQQVPDYSNYEYVFSSNEEEELVYVPSDQLSTHEDDFEDDRFSITPFVGDEFQAKKQSERVFNFKWLDIVAFKPWLLIDPKNRNIVRCSFCNRSYSARFNVLKDHCLSTKHLRNCPTLPVPKEEDFDIPSNDKSSHVLERSRAELKMVAMAAFLNIPLNNISEMSDCVNESTDVSKDKLLAIEVRFFDFEDLKECNWFHTDDDFFTSVQNQWDNIVNFQFKIESEEDVVNFWGHMFNIVDQDGNCLFNDVATFSLYILATPHSNVFPERRFSDMNNRKTKTTNRLSVETLNSRIMTAQVKKLFNTTEFEPTKEMLETAARGRFYDNKYKEPLYID